MAKQAIDWSSLWKKDEWLAVWIGFLIIILTLAGLKLTNVNLSNGPRTESLPLLRPSRCRWWIS